MSESKTTPGPWEAVGESDGRICILGIGDYEYPIASVYPNDSKDADAALIAAAPDLLEACVRMLDSWTLTCEKAPYQQREAIAAIRAALAKARGR